MARRILLKCVDRRQRRNLFNLRGSASGSGELKKEADYFCPFVDLQINSIPDL